MAEKRTANVPLAQVIERAKATRDMSLDYRGASFTTVASTIEALRRGQRQDHWMDFAAHMLNTDGHLRTVHDTRINGVIGSEVVVEPASDDPLDVKAADFCRESYEETRDLGAILYHLLYAESVGFTGCEQVYERRRGAWHIQPVPVRPRDLRVDPDWYYEVRTYSEVPAVSGYRDNAGVSYGERWLPTKDQRNRWMLHAPTSGTDTVLTAGDLLACAAVWFFKKELKIGWLRGLERSANGLVIARHPPGTQQATINKLESVIKNLSFSHGGAIENTVDMQYFATQVDTTGYNTALTYFDEELSKILLGSTLNTDVGDVGSYALGRSQFATTTLPRLEAIAARLAETITRDWFEPLLFHNITAFGRLPRAPKVSFKIMGDEKPTITRDGIEAGTVTKDELRIAQGLAEWGAERGGEEVAEIAAVAAPAAFSEDSAAGGAAPRPLQLSTREGVARMAEPSTRTLPIGGTSMMRDGSLQTEPSENRERLLLGELFELAKSR